MHQGVLHVPSMCCTFATTIVDALQVKLLQQLVQQQAAGGVFTAPVAPTPAVAPAAPAASQLLDALTLLQQQQQSQAATAAAAAPSLTAQLQQLTLAAAALEGQKAAEVSGLEEAANPTTT